VSPTNLSVNVFSTQAPILDTTLLNNLFTASAGKGTDVSVWSSEPYAVPFSVLCCFKTLCDLGIEPPTTHSVSFYRLELHKPAAVMIMSSRQIFIRGRPAPLPLPQSPAPYSFTTIFYSFISSRIFENRAARKGPEYSHIENFRRKLAVLVGLIVKLSPRGDLPWDGKGPPCQSLAGRLLQKRGMFS